MTGIRRGEGIPFISFLLRPLTRSRLVLRGKALSGQPFGVRGRFVHFVRQLGSPGGGFQLEFFILCGS